MDSRIVTVGATLLVYSCLPALASSGAFVFDITVQVNSKIQDPISCTASVGTNYYQSRTVTATRSRDTAACKVVMYYSWPQAKPNDRVSVSVSVSPQKCDFNCPPGYRTQGASSSETIPLPANGKKKTLSYEFSF